MAEYYDYILALIPVSLAGLTGLFVITGMSLLPSLVLASIATLGIMGHAMFVNVPGRSTDKTETTRPADRGPNDGSSMQ